MHGHEWSPWLYIGWSGNEAIALSVCEIKMIFRRINALAIVRKLAGTTVNANQVEVLTRTWASGGLFDTKFYRIVY